MKKIFVAIMAMAAFAACSTNEVISASQGDAIEFSNAFVGNSVRSIDPSITTNTLDNFLVYGTVTNTSNVTANIFFEELVSRSGAQWVYDANHTQYWVKGNTYNFYAVKNATEVLHDTNGVPTELKYTADGVTDLLFDEELGLNYAGNVQPVKFDFRHLLSKVKFTVKNINANGNGNSYMVKNVKINDAVETAVYTVGGTWGSHATNAAYDVEFGNIVAKNETAVSAAALKMLQGYEGSSNYERLLVPQVDAPLNITATVEYYVQNKMDLDQDVLVDTYTATVDATHTLEAGCAYNFVLELGNPGEPITFTVNKVEDWDQESVALNPIEVASADALVAAVAAGNNVVLTQDITLGAPLAIAEGQNVIVDLGGKTLTVEQSNFINKGTLVMKDGVVSGVNTQAGRRAFTNNGIVTLDNVTLKQVYAAGGAALINDGANAVATLKNATIEASNMAISNKNGATMTIEGGNYVGNGTGASYCVCNQLGSTLTVNGGSFEGGHGVIASSEASTTVLNAGTYHCTATYTGNSDWVLYANGDNSVVRYDESECVLTHAVKSGVVNTTEANGQVVAF